MINRFHKGNYHSVHFIITKYFDEKWSIYLNKLVDIWDADVV